jgi:hypothetical protein
MGFSALAKATGGPKGLDGATGQDHGDCAHGGPSGQGAVFQIEMFLAKAAATCFTLGRPGPGDWEKTRDGGPAGLEWPLLPWGNGKSPAAGAWGAAAGKKG